MISEAGELYPDLYALSRFAESHPSFNQQEQPLSALTILYGSEKTICGFSVLTNALRPENYRDEDLQVILSLKEHIAYAFIKTRLLEDLKTLKEKKNEFLEIAACDLRNPLTSIIGYTDLIVSLIRKNNIRLNRD